MATILRGKHKGLEVKIHQFCNDWFYIEHENIGNQDAIKSPTALEFTAEEIERINSSNNVGFLLHVYEWDGNRLKKRKVFRGSAV